MMRLRDPNTSWQTRERQVSQSVKNHVNQGKNISGPVFTKGLKCGLKVETFVSAKFCLKSIFTKGDLTEIYVLTP